MLAKGSDVRSNHELQNQFFGCMLMDSVTYLGFQKPQACCKPAVILLV